MNKEEVQLSVNAVKVLEKRYLKKDDKGQVIERPIELFVRVAENIASAERLYQKTDSEISRIAADFLEIMTTLRFLPNSPTLMNAGRELQQLSACFVLPVEDSMDEIFESVKNAALIHKSGGGTGFAFSRLRPKDDIVRTTSGVASGPVSFMKIFDCATEQIKQGSFRRGANMGILSVDHPDILEFITCKVDMKSVTNFNISVAVTDDFMYKVKADEHYDLINPRTGAFVKSLRARDVFDLMTENAHRNGDPGMIFIDRINQTNANPVPHIGDIEATNPCGEQPLHPYDSCNLGSINVAKFVEDGRINWEQLRETIHISVRFLDNVIDVNKYPVPEIERMSKGNRKIGLGVMGWADLLIKLGIRYDSQKALDLGEKLMKFLDDESKNASERLAEERGVFTHYRGSRWEGVRKPRNSTTTTVAPTGTISIIADCSSGIEPLFALAYKHQGLEGTLSEYVHPLFLDAIKNAGLYTEELIEKVKQTGSVKEIPEVPQHLRPIFVTASEIAPIWHLKVQAAFQKYTDNAVSKTINLPNSATIEDVKNIYMAAYDLGCRGITIYRDMSRETQVLVKGSKSRYVHIRERPEKLEGITYKINTGSGVLFVTINKDEDSNPLELFATLGKAGGSDYATTEGLGRSISLMLRAGIDPKEIVKQYRGISCDRPYGFGEERVLSIPDAISRALEKFLIEKGVLESSLPNMDLGLAAPKDIGTCPECGAPLLYVEGCRKCSVNCGYNECS